MIVSFSSMQSTIGLKCKELQINRYQYYYIFFCLIRPSMVEWSMNGWRAQCAADVQHFVEEPLQSTGLFGSWCVKGDDRKSGIGRWYKFLNRISIPLTNNWRSQYVKNGMLHFIAAFHQTDNYPSLLDSWAIDYSGAIDIISYLVLMITIGASLLMIRKYI